QPTGPPGVGLEISGSGYNDCGTVYFFFAGKRVGSEKPDADGAVKAKGLSVPGDTKPGTYEVATSCSPSGRSIRASSSFAVTDASVHRSALVTSLAEPGQVSTNLARIATSAAVAAGFLLLFAFPFQLFNSTVEDNYDEIRGWFRLPARAVETVASAGRNVAFFVLTLLTAIVIGFLSPDFGLNRSSLVLVVGYSLALLVMSVGFSLPADIAIHRQTGEWGKLEFLPGTLLVSIVMVALSRLMHFQPGYFYGALAGLAFRSSLSPGTQGRLTTANWLFALFLSVGAWFLRIPVSHAAAQTHASTLWIGLEACLALIFLWGIEGLAVAMLPMRFLDGSEVIDWSRAVWALLMFLGLFTTIHVLLSPTSGYVGHTNGQVAIGVVTLFVIFGAISVGLWAYFRFRSQGLQPRQGTEFLNQ
ncbi:MAG: hypothetical protein M3Y04_01120, partial [Actinomycetota bacterium]|nr:hypothetical protein [Actinomycetota bacterium]